MFMSSLRSRQTDRALSDIKTQSTRFSHFLKISSVDYLRDDKSKEVIQVAIHGAASERAPGAG